MIYIRVADNWGNAMKCRLLFSLLPLMLAVPVLGPVLPAPASAQAVSKPAHEIALAVGKGELITLPGKMADVFVANDAIADVQVKAGNQLYLFGKGSGITTVYASNAMGAVVWSANVRVGSNIDSLGQMLHLAMPEAKITASPIGTGTVLLTGIIAAPEDGAEAQRLVQAFLGKDTNVITRLKMATPLQVNLQVRIAEVSRSLLRNIGGNLMSRDATGGFNFGISRGSTPGSITSSITNPFTGQTVGAGYPNATVDAKTLFPGVPGIQGTVSVPVNPATGQIAFPPYATTTYNQFSPNSVGTTALGVAGKLFGLNLLGSLDLGEQVGLVTTLANPNLTVISGETADFLAGGEYPIPVPSAGINGNGVITIDYKKYGVSLSYTPTVLADGRISLKVRPEVSELSSDGAVSLNGFSVPALTIRRAETTVELGSGQSFMIAGLLSNKSQHTIEKTPGAGDIPVLGSLFRSTNFQRGETELVIVITPYLVNPVDANDIKLPTDGYQDPNEIQRVLGNMDSAGKSGGERPKPSEAQPPSEAKPDGATVPSPAPAQPSANIQGK